MAQNLISSLAWVSRGYALRIPRENEMEEQDIEEMKLDPRVGKHLSKDLGKIQEQEEDSSGDHLPIFCKETEAFARQQFDEEYPEQFDEMSDEEKEDYQIKSTDALIIAAKIENEFSSLEIYVYEEEKANLYVHHEIQLSAFPLAVEWLKIQPSGVEESATKGNFAIVASFLPEIEIWDLDLANVIEPSIVLGGEEEQSYKKVKNLKKQQKKYKTDSHTDSVISLSMNSFKPQILLSGSADTTVKIWDIQQSKCVFTYNHHKDKLQVTRFNTKEESIILTASEDRMLHIFDARTPAQMYSHKLPGNVEGAIWDPINGYNIVYCTEQGQVTLLDARKITEKPVASVSTKKSVSSVSMSSQVQGLLAATSLDGKIRVYDTMQNLKLITQYNPKLDSLYCGSFYQDSPWTFACGSAKGELFVWDLQESAAIVSHFGERMPSELRPKIEDCTKAEQEDILFKEREQNEAMEQEDHIEQEEDA